MFWAAQTGFLQARPERLAPAMEADGDVVDGHAEARRDTVARLPDQIGAPDNLGILRLESRQDPVQAVADYRVDLGGDREGAGVHVRLVQGDLPPPGFPHHALVVGNRGRQHAREPSADPLHVAQVAGSLKGTQCKPLEYFLGCLAAAEAADEISQEVVPALHNSATHRGVGGPQS